VYWYQTWFDFQLEANLELKIIKCSGMNSLSRLQQNNISRSAMITNGFKHYMKQFVEYPPGPHHIIPNKLLMTFMRDPLNTLTGIANQYGEISHFKFGRRHMYLLNNPDYIEDVLVTNPNAFIKSRGLQIAKRLLGNGLVTSECEFHHKQRRLIQPTFHPKHIRSYGTIMTDYAMKLSKKWEKGAVADSLPRDSRPATNSIDIHKEMVELTLSIICKTVLGSDIQGH
jgi:cytochrome P450